MSSQTPDKQEDELRNQIEAAYEGACTHDGFYQAHFLDKVMSLIARHTKEAVEAAKQETYRKTAIAFSGIVLGHIEQLKKDYVGRGGSNADGYWRGFSDLGYGLAEFMGKELGAQSNAEMMRQRLAELATPTPNKTGRSEEK